MKIRIKFAKRGHLKYIGHLDIMRCFQKIMRRAEVDITYSAGFSPHQIMSFASPLGLGLTSEGEYVDIEVESTLSSARMLEKINAVSVEGLEVLSYVKLPDQAKTAMAVIAAADYRLTFAQEVSEAVKEAFDDFLAQESIVITKKTKKKEMEMEIRPLIYRARFEKNQLFLQLSAGSVANLKPEQVMQAFFAFSKMDPLDYRIHRLEMYADQAGEGEERQLIPLEGMGEILV